MEYAVLAIYLTIAVGLSFLCSIAEAVLLSITPSYLAQLREAKTASALRIVQLKENIDRPLAAILSLNTIAHTVGAAGVGAQAARIYGDQYVGVISAILTLLILVISEIIPKTIGATHWRLLAGSIAVLVRWLIVLMLPLVWMSELLTRWLSGNKQQTLITRAEISAVAELGSQEGLLKSHESRILHNLMRLESIKVEDVMTPNTVIIAMDEAKKISELTEEIRSLPVSRVPIFQGQRDAITGFVLKSDLLTAIAFGNTEKRLVDFSRSLLAVHEDDSITVAFDTLLNTRAHIAIVVDKFGGLEGLVTLEDVVETLLGMEIVDEHDRNVNMRGLARQQWKKRLEKLGIDTAGAEE